MGEKEKLKMVAEQAKTLMNAAKILDEMAEAQSSMMEEGRMPADETSEEMEDDIETARDACESISVAMTIALAKKGYVPDFDAAEETEDRNIGADDERGLY